MKDMIKNATTDSEIRFARRTTERDEHLPYQDSKSTGGDTCTATEQNKTKQNKDKKN